MVRNWHELTGNGDPKHPLLAIDAKPYGYIPVTEEESGAWQRANVA